MEQKLARYQDWTPATVEERRGEIEAWAIKRWHVEPPRESDGDGAADNTEESGTREDKLRHLEELAEQCGVGRVYRTLAAAAGRHGLYLRPWPHALAAAPPANRNAALFSLWPQSGAVRLGFWFANWARFYGVPEQRAQDVMGADKWREITDANVVAFVEGLERLFGETSAAQGR